jgi:hypothetical protein
MYACESCEYKCSKRRDYDKHCSTRKHTRSINLTNSLTENIPEHLCNKCNKNYKSRVGLWYHLKKCNSENSIIDEGNNENMIVQDSSNNDIIHLLIKENSDFKSMIMDLVKSNTDLQKQMLEVCKNNNTTINATNNINASNTDNSKTFNMQVFLNEKCKNAMNLDDFANSIELKLSDLIRVGEEGYIPGMSKVFIERLKDVEVCDRPIHCTDEKREAIQVKMADKWEKEAIDSVKLTNAVRIVEQKQFKMIDTFREMYPECMNSDSHHNDMLISLFQNLSNSREPEFIKVMKKVAKSVVLDKEKCLEI